MSSATVANLMRGHIEKLAAQGKRTDGRGANEFRGVSIETGLIGTAEGSARVTYPDSPGRGSMTTTAELACLASEQFEPGPPREPAIELARVVDRGIRESQMIDFEGLCIEHGEKVWIVFIDMHILDHGGNLFDCCTLAAASALGNAKIPNVQHGIADKDVDLPLSCWPISCTFAKLGETIVLDPNHDEETVMNARLTVAHDENGNLRAMQKGYSGAFTPDEIKASVKTARTADKALRKALKEATK